MESDNKAVASCAADLIPYRCPKCGNRRRFATLRELKVHFESDHAFKTACVRPAVFRKDKENASHVQMGTNPNEQTYVIKSERIFSSPRNEMINTTCHDFNSETERTSPLLQSYKDEAAILELELQMSKQNEMRNKTENLRALSGNTVSSDFKSTLGALSKAVVKTRKQHWNTADALYQSHDIINGLEEAAETKCKEQRDIIRQLLNGMRVKDRELKLATKEQNELRNEQERLYQETEELFRRADQHNETLKRELNVRNGTLESLNNELDRIKSRTSSQLKEKENELKVAEEKMNRLKSERDQLIEETEMILKRADADSEELRLGLAIKEQTLQDVNEELNTLRNEKHLMLLKTMEFYKRTEEGNDIMKNIIRAKDEQLDQALEQLEKMKVVQKRLVEESQNLTDQADDNTTRMRAMLEAKKQEVEEKVLQLEKLKEEKLDLESQTKRTDSSVDEIETLQGRVMKKEKELSATKGQLKELKSFLQSAAEKERTARGKLEKFISELITRAERAESELRSLKSQSSSSLNGHKKLNKDSTKEWILADDQEENSPDLKISPAKPVRKKYSPAKPIRRQYNRNKNLTHDVVALSTDTWQDKFATSPEISSDIKAQNRTGSGKSERANRRVIHTINADVHKPVTDKVERDFQQKASVDDIDINFVTNSNSNIKQRQETIPKTKQKFKSNDQNIYMNDKLKVQNYPVLHNVSPHPAASSVCEQNLSSKNIITAHMQKYHNQITAHSEPIKSQSFLYPLTFQSSRNAHEISAPEKPKISEYGYYLPQPPQIEPAAEFRAPPYGHESTFSLNSIPRVPPHIYHLNNTSYGIGSPLPNVVRNQNRPRKRPSEQYAMVDFNSDTHSIFTPHHKLTAERRTTQRADKTFTTEAVERNYSNPVLDQTGLQKSRQEIKNYESKEQRMSSDRKGASEQVQYEEIQADEIDFPDELYVIPKSASEELTPELLTPERETIEEKFRRRTEQMHDEYDQTRGDLTRELVTKYIDDRCDRNFERIMDDNGILWDDMATLPDVSDSELDQLEDRLSPSGSEAIATKIQPNVPITNTNSNVINDRGSTENLEQFSVKKTSVLENDSFDNPNHSAIAGNGICGQSSKSSPLKDKNVHSRKLSPGLRNDSTGTERRQEYADDKLRKMGILNEWDGKNLCETTTDSNRTIDLDRRQALIRKNSSSKRFKPINASNSGKSSSSDKEMTSGGEEIHNFLRKSKHIIVHGSPDCRSDFTVKTDNDKLALDDHSTINETFDEKLRQISEKYSLKRHHSDMNHGKDNIKAITDKYRQRRKDILAQIMTSHSSNDNDSYLKPINRTETNHSKSVPVQEQINKPIESDLLRQAIPDDKEETENTELEGPENTGSRNVLENGQITSDIQIRNCTVTNDNLKSFHRHLNFEDNKENNIKINETKMFDKAVASFQIDNFKEIIHGKSTDLKSTANEKSQLIQKEETLQARERESFDNHSHDLLENKMTSGEIDNDCKSRNVSNVKPPKDIMHRMHHHANESDDVMYETTSQDDTPLCVPSKSELQNAQLTSESSSGGFSIFAEPINDSCSIGGDSNTQSLIDRNHFNDTDPDVDTDTESHCKGNIAEYGDETDFAARGMHLDYVDVQRMKSSRNTMSSASSQASIDFLDHVPFSRREIVRRRRQALCYIFSFLDCETLFRVAMVCREWKIVSRNPNLWTRLELRKNRISGKFLSQLARRCSKLRFLILEDLQPRPQLKSETIEEYIESTRCSLEAGLEQILKRSESTLVSLSIVNCGYMLSSKCLWAASCYSRMLNHVTYLSDIDPISAEVLWALGSGCRDIKTFRVAPIYPCQKPGIFNTKCLQLVGKCFRDLEILSIGGYEVDLSALTFVAKCCQRLECLELDHMGIVTKSLVKEVTDVGFKRIRELRFMGTPIESSSVKLLYDTCKHLKFIEIKLAPEDYFEGTQKPNDMKRYKGEMEKLKALSKKPGLGQILKLTL